MYLTKRNELELKAKKKETSVAAWPCLLSKWRLSVCN